MSDDITIVRKTTLIPTITVRNKDTGAVFNLSGYTMTMAVKANQTDTDANAIIASQTAVIATPSNGQGIFTFSKALTDIPEGDYWYDVRIDDGTNAFVVVGPAKFIVKEYITSR